MYAVGPENKLIPVLPGTPMGNPAQLVPKSSNNTVRDLIRPELTPTQPNPVKFLMVAPNTSNKAPVTLASSNPGVPSHAPSVGAKSPVNQTSPNNELAVKSSPSADKSSTPVVPKIQGTKIHRPTPPKIMGTPIDTPVTLTKAPGVSWFSTIPPDSPKIVKCRVTYKNVGIRDSQGNVKFNTPRGKIFFDTTSPKPSKGQVGTKVVDLTDEESPAKDRVEGAQGGQGGTSPATPQPDDEQRILNNQIIRAEHDYTPPLFDSDIIGANTDTTHSDHSDDSKLVKTTDGQEDSGSKGGKEDLKKSVNLSRQLRKRGGVYFADETITKRFKVRFNR